MAPPKKTKAAAGYKLAKEIPSGVEITDLFKKRWVVGPAIGQGGFGVIYSARLSDDKASQYNYVIKVEPRDNGPLYCEMAFYKRVAKEEFITEWKTNRKLKRLGVPRLLSAGNYEHNGEQLRYLVIDRFGEDLHRVIQREPLLKTTAVKIAIRVLDILEFIHSKEYVHADIKALNLLKGRKHESEMYLVDFGLAHRYTGENGHRVEKVDPKWKHNGTIEFCARDSHNALAPSRRSDIESLGFNLLFWLAGHLPWDRLVGGPVGLDIRTKPLQDKVKVLVANEKEKLMKNPKTGLLKSLDLQNIPGLTEYFNHVNNLGYTEQPDYQFLRKQLESALKSYSKGQSKSASDIDVLEWTNDDSSTSATHKQPKRRKSSSNNNFVSPLTSPEKAQSSTSRTLARKSPKEVAASKDASSKKTTAAKTSKGNDHNGIIPGICSASNSFTNSAKFSTKTAPTNDIIPGLNPWTPSSLRKGNSNSSTLNGNSFDKKKRSKGAVNKSTKNRKSAACQTSPQ